MPKKTKRQKIAAEMHKHKVAAQHTSTSTPEASQQSKTEPKRMVKKMLFTDVPTHFFKQDLIKSLLVTGMILAAELGIYIAQLNGLSFTINLPF